MSSPLILVFVLSFSIANVAHAQYTGPHYNVNRVSRPAPVGDCQNGYRGQTIPQAVIDACRAGTREGQIMAEKYAGGHGRIEGYQRGFSWGLYDGIENAKRDSFQFQNAQKDGRYQAEISSDATTVGVGEGNRRGTEEGPSEARIRWESAVDTEKFPSAVLPQPVLPTAPYVSGVGDPYAHVGRQFFTIQQLIQNASYDSSRFDIYNGYDTNYNGESEPFHPGNYYNAHGEYSSDYSGYFSADRAWNAWLARNGNAIPTRRTYEGYGSGTTIVVPRTSGSPAPAEQSYDLKAIFRTAFATAYNNEAQYYFNEEFNRSLWDGEQSGRYAGSIAGSQFVRQDGLRDGFNSRYHQLETLAFNHGYDSSFRASFMSEFNFYKTNPVITAEFIDAVGAVDDGINQPGEAIQPIYRIRNSGGVAASVPVFLEGDAIASGSKSMELAPIHSQVYRDENLGTYKSGIESKTYADVILNVNRVQYHRKEYVTRQITAEGIVVSARNIPQGQMSVTVTVQNQSTVPSVASVTVTITDSQAHTEQRNLGVIPGRSTGNAGTATATFVLAGYSPLDLLDGKIGVTAVDQMGLVSMGTDAVTLSSDRPLEDLLNSYDVATQDPVKQVLEKALEDRILVLIGQEIENDLKVYKGDDDSATVLGKVANLSNATHNANSQIQYRLFADRVSNEYSSKFKSITRKPARRAFQDLVDRVRGGK